MDLASLEINQTNLRAIRLSRSGTNLVVAKIAQTPLPPGLIKNGRIANSEQLATILANFLRAYRFGNSRWIVSIPEGVVYKAYKIFPNLGSEDLKEAVEINANSLLPGNLTTISWGWQEVEPLDRISGKEVMLASISQKDLAGYLEVFSRIGIVPIAIEPKSCSLARVFGKTDNILVLNFEGSILTSVMVKSGFPRFARQSEIEAKTEQELEKKIISEIRQVTNYYLMEKNQLKIEGIILDGPNVRPELAKKLANKLKLEVKLMTEMFQVKGFNVYSLPLLGAGIRALYDPRTDHNLSLLPVGVKEAAEGKRTLLFYGGLANLVVITTLLFLMLFWGTFIFLGYLEKSLNNQLVSLASSQGLKDDSKMSQIRQDIREINPYLEMEASLEDQIGYLAPLIKKIDKLIPAGINLTQINYTGENISLVGRAQSQDALVTFRDNLARQNFSQAVQMPSSTYTQGQNIDFTLAITLTKEAFKRK